MKPHSMKTQNIELGQLVVMSHELEATVFRVKQYDSTNGFIAGVIDATIEDQGSNQRVRWIDKSGLMTPSIGQIKRFINKSPEGMKWLPIPTT